MQLDLSNYYHFIATFEDGHQIFQDESDVSSFDPSRSQFFDVLEYQQTSPLTSFVLTSEGRPTFGVDLRDGHFEVNQIPFFPYRVDREQYSNFRVIYYRNVEHRKDVITGTVTSILGYTLGFQALTEDDKSVKHIIKI